MTLELKAMDVKKHEPLIATKGSEVRSFKMLAFFGNIKEEFSKITWTSPEELRLYTKVVVAATFLLGLAIYSIDLVIQGGLAVISGLFKAVFG